MTIAASWFTAPMKLAPLTWLLLAGAPDAAVPADAALAASVS
jgi:hypothetical protein